MTSSPRSATTEEEAIGRLLASAEVRDVSHLSAEITTLEVKIRRARNRLKGLPSDAMEDGEEAAAAAAATKVGREGFVFSARLQISEPQAPPVYDLIDVPADQLTPEQQREQKKQVFLRNIAMGRARAQQQRQEAQKREEEEERREAEERERDLTGWLARKYQARQVGRGERGGGVYFTPRHSPGGCQRDGGHEKAAGRGDRAGGRRL